jgi:tetratricopeptide (TPR) repeat protein
MRNWKTTLAVVVVAGLMAVAALAQSAKSVGKVTGSVEDENGQPWQGVSVTLTNPQTGVHFSATTDATGKYSIENVPTGPYTLTIDTNVYPAQSYQVEIKSGTPLSEDLNFQKVIKDNPKLAAQLKQAKQFVLLKKHFEAGLQAMNQVKSLRQHLGGEAADKQSATQQQITQLSQTAVTELQQAQKVAAPTDPNMPIILGNLAMAYELSGKHDEAADTFTQASQLKPTDPNLLQGAATNLAYSGKLDEASADCEKVTTLSPQSGGTCWRNIGVVLYNTNQMQKAVQPLQKAAQADPSNPTTWYLLGEALMNAMQSKMVNGKLTAIIQPGTAEAFQKYLQLAPNGPQAAAAKQSLQVLQQLGAGVDTKYVAPEEKKKGKH